jgi:uncharacterized membrane protein
MTVARGSTRRGILLGASLGLNLFLAGVIGAHMLRPMLAGPPPGSAEGPLGRLIGALPPDDAQRVRAVLERERPNYVDARMQISVARREVAAAIARTPYDEAAVRAALSDWHDSLQRFAARFDVALLEALGTVSDHGRTRLADAITAEDARHRGGGR